MPAAQGPPPYEVLAALVASLRQELADAQGALAMVLIVACSLGRARQQEQARQRSHRPDTPVGSGRPDHSTPAN